jgi:predicted Rossmann fold flavoprotein
MAGRYADVIVLGGGAAGLFCALTAGSRGRSVLVLEHAPSPGRKILISGGGRCNFTNLWTTPDAYLSENPNFCKSALARYTPQDFVALVERHGIAYYEKKLGQLFCRENARQILEMLLAECHAGGADLRTGCQILAVDHQHHFRVETSQGTFESGSLVVATGGLSIPKMGATNLGYRIASQFGLRLVDMRPALVPLLLAADISAHLAPLSGISLDASLQLGGAAFRENILLTHQGLSGPAILQISSYWHEGESVTIDLLPDYSAHDALGDPSVGARELQTVLSQFWPARFAQAWSELAGAAGPLRAYTTRRRHEIAEQIHHWTLTPTGTEGYRKAEVTAGGVDTRDLSSRTMEARSLPGLFFIGEVVDVTGHLGGYNFQWAWASAHAAGLSV